ncbi:MAG: hypothetical protein KatS3mg009_0053 [Acidimicrobiia bacterium]|nr:MAG: hypothetical protein KatS3mg009_0053 [Acidimicrobiia bacterium]
MPRRLRAVRPAADTVDVAALTIGITTARSPECKRGVAVNVAASLARRLGPGRVCVVDADPLARDVTTRLGVRGPYLEDFGGAAAPPVARLPRCSHPPLTVVGTAGDAHGRLRLGAQRALPALRAHFGVVVCDLVVGPSGPGRVVGGRLEVLDWLLLAVTPRADELGPAQHFVEHVETARARGALDPRVRLGVVCTGDEGSTDLTPDEVAAAVAAPVVGVIPQLWGRSEPNRGFGAALAVPQVDDAVRRLHAVLTGPGAPACA